MKQFRNPENVHQPVAQYTHQIEVTGNERLLFLSGQIGMDKDGNLPESSLDQLAFALDNILINLQAANMAVSDLTKLTLYVVGSDMEASGRGEILSTKLGDHIPCMTLLFVAALANPKLKVEIDAFAASDT
jgi:2-iminobutanoate/2-iminopropanoate deaminase